ncbi:MAG: hypothetical protein SO063_08815, partial [Eubacteriales bacterium]|nr:hypothetical protein [Eubacteriales bacterium]
MPASRGTQAANEETYAREEEQGIRHNWLMGSMASSVMILTACMLLLICSVTAFFYLSLRGELTSRAENAVDFLTKYSLSDQNAMQYGARSYVASYENRSVMEIQYLAADG